MLCPLLPNILPTIGQVSLTLLSDLRPFMKNVNCKFIVLVKGEERVAKDGSGTFITFKIADESGTLLLVLWGESGKALEPSDIIIIIAGFVTMYQNTIRLACKLGTIVRTGRFSMLFKNQPDYSAFEWLPNPEKEGELKRQELATILSSSISSSSSSTPMTIEQHHPLKKKKK